MERYTENVREVYTDVFLSHNWGKDSVNHKKVSLINKKLIEQGYETWFDEKNMWGCIDKKMQQGIEDTKGSLSFLLLNTIKKLTARMLEIIAKKNLFMHHIRKQDQKWFQLFWKNVCLIQVHGVGCLILTYVEKSMST